MADLYPALKTTIAGAPYSTMTDAQIIAALNAETVVSSAPVPMGQVFLYFIANGLWSAIEASSNAAAKALVALCNCPQPIEVNMTASYVVTALNSMVTAGLLTSAQSTAIQALSQSTTSIAAQLGFPNGVTEADLTLARSGA